MDIDRFTKIYENIVIIIDSSDFAEASINMKHQILSAKKVLDVLGNLFKHSDDVCLYSVSIDFNNDTVKVTLELQNTYDLLAIASWYIVIYEDKKIPQEEKNMLKNILAIAFNSTNPDRFSADAEITEEDILLFEDSFIDDPDVGNSYWYSYKSMDEFLDSEVILVSPPVLNRKDNTNIFITTGRRAIQQYLTLRDK